MKVGKKLQRAHLIASTAVLAMSQLAIAWLSPAYADNPSQSQTGPTSSTVSYVYVYNESLAGDIKTAVDKEDHTAAGPVSNVQVYAQGGPFGSTPTLIAPDFEQDAGRSQTTQLNFGKAYLFRGHYTCNNYDFEFNVQLDMSSFTNATTKSAAFYTKAVGNGKTITPAGNALAADPASLKTAAGASCVVATQTSLSQPIKNFNKLSATEKTSWQGLSAAANAPGSPGGGSNDTGCTGPGGSGWIVCMVIEVEDAVVTWVEQKVIEPFLDTPRLSFTDTSDNPQYKAWSAIRAVANVFFVLIFLVIIFANTFSLQNYNVKKTLPKLVVAAVLVQLSFVLMAAAIDITNIIGVGLRDLVDGIVPPIEFNGNKLIGTGSTFVFAGIGMLALANSIASVGILSSMLPLLFGMLAVLFTLVLRQALIVILIMTAPIALCAFVLPGTEKFFKSWLNLFIRALLMYPIIVLLFAAGKVAAFAAAASGNVATTATAITPIMVMLCLGIPLLAVPFAFTFAGGLVGRLGKASLGGVGGVGKKFGGSQYMKDAQQLRKESGAMRFATSDNKISKAFGAYRAGTIIPTKGARQRLRAASQGAMNARENGINSTLTDLSRKETPAVFSQILKDLVSGKEAGGIKADPAARSVALKRLVKTRQWDDLRQLHGSVGKSAVWKDVVDENWKDINEAAPDLVESTPGEFGKLRGLNGEQFKNLDASTVDAAFSQAKALDVAQGGTGNVDRLATGLQTGFDDVKNSPQLRNSIRPELVAAVSRNVDTHLGHNTGLQSNFKNHITASQFQQDRNPDGSLRFDAAGNPEYKRDAAGNPIVSRAKIHP